MAKLSPQTLTIVFDLQRRLVELIDESKATEYSLFESFGETEATIGELQELQDNAQRARNSYSRLHNLILRIAEYQPIAPSAMLELLTQTINNAEASADAIEAGVREIKRTWNLS
ncbi:conserved hypothetical protein [Gloeothece citriformis PCC 7424]|uniref:Uncharacterized protein n=1 Tax=Gloeothece citriformis (strain PCC 7424) TaxID=65393 RepID=B7KK46_GLOC7|nr:hypothetical protein [Gloeothece citriformis]ACK70931.1 conserved hypothetical protein [Gloeothece citriformis PCC 7424]